MRFGLMAAAAACVMAAPASAATMSIQTASIYDDVFIGWYSFILPATDTRPQTYISGTLTNDIEGLGGFSATCKQAGIGDCPDFFASVTPTRSFFSVGGEEFQLGYGYLRIPHGYVPEPSTWALMILGFAGAAGMMRRRHLKPAPHTA